jgi:hypothetical protein
MVKPRGVKMRRTQGLERNLRSRVDNKTREIPSNSTEMIMIVLLIVSFIGIGTSK